MIKHSNPFCTVEHIEGTVCKVQYIAIKHCNGLDKWFSIFPSESASTLLNPQHAVVVVYLSSCMAWTLWYMEHSPRPS